MALGDLTRSPKLRPRVVYTSLERPSDREAYFTFLRQIRQLNTLRESVWEERRRTLDPTARRWSEDLPKGSSKWLVVYRGKACRVYADYDFAKRQIFQVSGRKLRGFPDAAAAGAADQLRQALERQPARPHANGRNPTHQHIHTDGSFTKADPVQHNPDRAGWGYIVVRQSETLC